MSANEALFNYFTKHSEYHERKFGYRPCDTGVPEYLERWFIKRLNLFLETG
jgi:hypothetical protein